MFGAYLENVTIVVTGLESLGNKAKQYAFQGVIEGQKIAFAASIKKISVQEYSLADLAMMGHPYGAESGPFTRHAKTGRQEGAARGPIPFADPDIIEVQGEGGYRDALKAMPPVGLPGEIVEGTIQIDPANPEMVLLDRWLQEGTVKMVARPWMEDVVRDEGERIVEAIRKGIMVGMKADLGEQVGGI